MGLFLSVSEGCILGNTLGSGVTAGVHCDAVAEVRCAAGGEDLGGVLQALRVEGTGDDALVAGEAVAGGGAEATESTDLQSCDICGGPVGGWLHGGWLGGRNQTGWLNSRGNR